MSADGRELSMRKRLILKAIIEAHVKAGEPVGSKFLTMNKQIALSSATIRNEMAELEEMGYLEQPHTSAGRVPSESGYRFYVNSLMQQYRLSAAELRRLNNLVQSRLEELDKMLENATKLAANLTNYTSLAVKPKQNTVLITQFKTMLLGPGSFLLVMMTNHGIVKTRQIHMDFMISEEILKKLEILLNAYITNISVEEITLPVIMRMENSLPECSVLINPIVKCVYEVINEMDSGELKVAGVNHLLQYPEYTDVEDFKELLGLLEKKEEILNIVSKSDDEELHVFIGSENCVEVMHNSTLVFKKIISGRRVVGAIGIIGPCRMDYSRVISTIEYLTNSISDIASKSGHIPITGMFLPINSE